MIEIVYVIYLLLAVILIWKTTFAMIEKRSIIMFLPFFAIGIIWIIRIVFVIHDTPFGIMDDVTELIEILLFLWITYDLWCRKWK